MRFARPPTSDTDCIATKYAKSANIKERNQSALARFALFTVIRFCRFPEIRGLTPTPLNLSVVRIAR